MPVRATTGATSTCYLGRRDLIVMHKYYDLLY